MATGLPSKLCLSDFWGEFGVGTCSNMHKLQTLMGSWIAIWYNSLPNATQNPTHDTQMFKNKRITKSLMTKAPNLF